MSDTLKKIYYVDDLELSPLANAYARARGADRMSSTGASAEGETVDFHFESSTEELDAAPVYTVSHLLAPNRIILTLHGVRTIDYEAISESLLSTEAVQSVSRAMIGDDSMFGFIIVLNRSEERRVGKECGS